MLCGVTLGFGMLVDEEKSIKPSFFLHALYIDYFHLIINSIINKITNTFFSLP